MKNANLPFMMLLLLGLLAQPACKLEPEKDPLAEALKAEAHRFEANPEAVGFEYLKDAYAELSRLHEYSNLWGLEELTTDEAVQVPAGLDWDDQGLWNELSLHAWGPRNNIVRQVWNQLLNGQSAILRAQNVFDQAAPSAEVDAIRAEAQALKILFYYYLIDLYGQMPARDEAGQPVVYRREEAFGITVAQLTGLLDELPAKTRFGDERALFRMNQAAAKALLARLYLNQKEYAPNSVNETDALNNVIRLCDELINSDQYGLEGDYWVNFRVENRLNTTPVNELIFTAWNGTEGGFTNTFANLALNSAHFTVVNGWNGFCTLSDFYDKWDQQDPRFRGPRSAPVNAYFGFNAGYQFDENGDTLRLSDGQPLFYATSFNLQENNPAAGARPLKYAPDNILALPLYGAANLYAIIRLAEVYLMKAEAQYRLGQPEAARTTLNALREARGAAPLASLTETDLLDEYGFELWWEGQRRSHLIRFGQYNAPNSVRLTASEPYRKLFPIPQEALDVNPNLRQNPGY
jgi:starch-binding outer membrane protein, SusD/RagB family